MGLGLSWKSAFYGGVIPILRRMSRRSSSRALDLLGQLGVLWPGRSSKLVASVRELDGALHAGWQIDQVARDLARGLPHYLARDYLLDGLTQAEFENRFEIRGLESLDAALRSRNGVILVGCHLGGHLAALHWLYRRDLRLRLLVQRPHHVSARLNREFDRCDDELPQRDFFVRRNLDPREAATRILKAWSALRNGYLLYLNSDVPWNIPSARRLRFLGKELPILSLWADLAAVSRASVVPIFCTRTPEGRHRIEFLGPWLLSPGDEDEAIRRYLAVLERKIIEHPADAVPYLLWPHYRGPNTGAPDIEPEHPPRRVTSRPRLTTIPAEARLPA